jgi:hypothetical protein
MSASISLQVKLRSSCKITTLTSVTTSDVSSYAFTVV